MKTSNSRLRATWGLIAEVITRLNGHHGAHAAAAVSYYVLLSVAPLLVLAVTVASWIVSPAQAQRLVIELVSPFVPGAGAGGDNSLSQLLPEIVRGRGAATGIGLLMLVWAGSAALVGLETSINFAWNTTPRRSYFAKRFLGTMLMLVFALILATSLAASISISAIRNLNIQLGGLTFSQWPLPWKLARFFVPLIIAVAAFTMVYKIVPTKHVQWRVALFGGVVAGVLWEVAKQLFGYYVVHFSIYSTLYGSLTSIILFTIWVNYSALVAILGAEVAATMESRIESGRATYEGDSSVDG